MIIIMEQEKELSIKDTILNKLEEENYKLGISYGFQIICEILDNDLFNRMETIDKIIAGYIRKICLEEVKIGYIDNTMVFPCASGSILCIEDSSVEKPLIIAVADTIELQSKEYSLLRNMASTQEAIKCIQAVLDGEVEQGFWFLRKTIFSSNRIKHILGQEEYQNFLAVWDAITCSLFLEKNIPEDFLILCREILSQREYIVKVNGEPNRKMYALLDYIQYIMQLGNIEIGR